MSPVRDEAGGDMSMDTLAAAAILGPALGAVAACNAWAVFVMCKQRYFSRPAQKEEVEWPITSSD